MDYSIIWLLVWMIIFDAASFYLGFIKPPWIWSRHSKASFIGLTFLLIPFVIFVLWGQSTAIERLEAEGIVPHPAITNSVGITTGIITEGTFLFEADTTPQEAMNFYMEESNRPGWTLNSQSPVMHIFIKDGRQLVIAANREWSSDPTVIMYRFDK